MGIALLRPHNGALGDDDGSGVGHRGRCDGETRWWAYTAGSIVVGKIVSLVVME